MSFGSTLGIAVIGAMVGLVASGCTAATDDPNAHAGGENIDSTSEELAAGSCTPSLASGAVTPKQRALLDTIAFTEGTRGRSQDGYNVTFAYHYFASCGHHPNLDHDVEQSRLRDSSSRSRRRSSPTR